MRIKITKDQLHEIKETDSLKKLVFRYWDKFKPEVNPDILKLFSIERSFVTMFDLHRWLREYLGKEKIQSIIKELFSKQDHKIDDCGGYDFDFTVDYVMDDGQAVMKILVDDVKGSVILIMTGGEMMNLRDARKDEEIGWEIDNEIEGCISDYFDKNLENKTGVPFVFENIEYTSDLE